MDELWKEIALREIEGIQVGNAQNSAGGTGCTAILCERGAAAGADVRGGAPATRETDLLKPQNTVEKIHCVMLSGGSAYGLDACAGAMRYLEERKAGFDTGAGVVPIVCGASLFDLAVGDAACRPDSRMGYEACKDAERNSPAEGNAGAGTGASVGKYLGAGRMMKSGLGIYAAQLGAVKCAAIVAVNALGDVIDAQTGQKLAGLLNEAKTAFDNTEMAMLREIHASRDVFAGNTTVGCIVTNAKLTKTQANKLAAVVHNAYARTIRPVHTSLDGDTVFVMATGETAAAPDALGVLATRVMETAIGRAVKKAVPAYGLKAARDFMRADG